MTDELLLFPRRLNDSRMFESGATLRVGKFLKGRPKSNLASAEKFVMEPKDIALARFNTFPEQPQFSRELTTDSAVSNARGRHQPPNGVSESPAFSAASLFERVAHAGFIMGAAIKGGVTSSNSKQSGTNSVLAQGAGDAAAQCLPLEEVTYSLSSDDYDLGSLIGTQISHSHVIGFGSSATVYVALYKPLNQNVAVKMIDLDQFERNQIEELRVFLQSSVLVISLIFRKSFK